MEESWIASERRTKPDAQEPPLMNSPLREDSDIARWRVIGFPMLDGEAGESASYEHRVGIVEFVSPCIRAVSMVV